jgi:integrase
MSRYSREQYKSGQHALSPEEVEALLLKFDNIQDKAMIALAIHAGIRREDLVNIKAVDFDEKEGSVTFLEHKKKKTRTVYIPSEEVVQLIKMHLNTCRRSDWLFPSPRTTQYFKNKHVSGRHAYDVFNEHLDKAKITRRPFHSLRATCYKQHKNMVCLLVWHVNC